MLAEEKVLAANSLGGMNRSPWYDYGSLTAVGGACRHFMIACHY